MSGRLNAHQAPKTGRGGDRWVGLGRGGGEGRAWRSGAFWLGFADSVMRACEAANILLGILLTASGNMPAAAYPVAFAIYLRLLRKGTP